VAREEEGSAVVTAVVDLEEAMEEEGSRRKN
jgi:hypothetical protein